MESYLEQAPCIYFSSKDDGTLIDVNDTLCTRLGFCREELLGQRLDILFTVPTRIFQQTHFFPLLKIQGHAEEIYITLQTKDKEQIPVLINAERKAINGVAVNSYIGIIVHNRKKFEEELIAAKKAAEQALNENTTLIQTKQELQQHLEQLDHQINIVNKQNKELRQFNRVVTHDLQEPLRKLSVFSNILLEGKEKPEQRTIVQKIANVSEQMRSIISGLQQYIWLTETLPNITDVPLEDLLTSVRQQLENEFPQIHLIIDVEDLPVIEGDGEQMQVLFYQLLSNAIRFRKDEREAYVKISANNLMLNTFRN
ncbi:MAG: PAS domain-containing protein, partial [Flavisolibacter sp.]|nr:PAS domain-containing protein [Flavisolibacter sp.]